LSNEPKFNLRYEAVGCLLGLFLTVGLMIVSLLTLAFSTLALMILLRLLPLSDEVITVLLVVWIGATLAMTLGATIWGGSMVYERIMRRWFGE
jgi:hypothetical protein